MISNDVNVIFAYIDVNDKFHSKSKLFVGKNKRRKYIMLANVMKSFLKTYKNYILLVGDIIESEVIECKRERKTSPIKVPSITHITTLINSGITQELKKLSLENKNYSKNTLTRFKDLLLSEYSIPQLYFEESSMGEFREKYIRKSYDFSLKNLNEFLNSFLNVKTMKLTHYENYDTQLLNLKNMKDYEDRKICAELFCHGNEIGKISFLTFDNAFKKFLKSYGFENNVKILQV